MVFLPAAVAPEAEIHPQPERRGPPDAPGGRSVQPLLQGAPLRPDGGAETRHQGDSGRFEERSPDEPAASR